MPLLSRAGRLSTSSSTTATTIAFFAPQSTARLRRPTRTCGQVSAFNAGLSHSDGEIVLLLDSDDVLRPEAVATFVELFAATPSLARSHGRMEVIDAEGYRVGKLKPESHLPMPGGDLLPETLRFPFDLAWLPTSANAFAGPVIRQIFPMPEEDNRSGADSCLVHASSLFGPVGATEHVVASYRVHGENGYEQQSTSIDLPHIREGAAERLGGSCLATLGSGRRAAA